MQKPVLTGAVQDTEYFRLFQYGIQYVEIDELHPEYMYPPGTVHPGGRFIVEPVKGATGDFNGDGFQDLVVNWAAFPHQVDRVTPIEFAVLLNDGQGNLGTPNANIVGPINDIYMRYRPTVADLNGDGVDDIVFAGSSLISWNTDGSDASREAPISLILSQPGGRLIDASANIEGQEQRGKSPDAYSFGHEISAGDVDGDGDADLFSGRILLLNDAEGNFSNVHELLPPEAKSYEWVLISSAFADVDKDGVDELILAYAEGPTYLLKADWSGTAVDWQVIELPRGPFGEKSSPNSMTTADVKHDGNLDIIIGQTRTDPFYLGRAIQILINDGTGHFVDETHSRIDNAGRAHTSWGEGEVHIVDVDLDGDLDLYDSASTSGNYLPDGQSYGPGTAIALNDGFGRFAWVDESVLLQLQPSQLIGPYDWSWAENRPIGVTFPIDLDGKNGIDYVGNFTNPFYYPQTVPSGVTLFSALSTKPLHRGTDETLGGLSTPDYIAGFDGNDQITGAGGDDVIDGGEGIDTAVYGGDRSNYVVNLQGEFVLVSDIRPLNLDGADHLDFIERIRFRDGVLAIDIEGNSGQAYRLYQTAFEREPDAEGLSYWIGRMDEGAPLSAVADSFLHSPEYLSTYGTPDTVSNAEFVELLYRHTLGRGSDGEGFDYWLERLDAGATNHRDLLVQFSESPENKAQTYHQISDGIWLPH